VGYIYGGGQYQLEGVINIRVVGLHAGVNLLLSFESDKHLVTWSTVIVRGRTG